MLKSYDFSFVISAKMTIADENGSIRID